MKSKTSVKNNPAAIYFDFSIPVHKKKLFGNLFVQGTAFKNGNKYEVAIEQVLFDNADVSKVLEVFGGMDRIVNAAKQHAEILESFK